MATGRKTSAKQRDADGASSDQTNFNAPAEPQIMPGTAELFDITLAAMQQRARQMLRGFPAVHRWDETDDICQTVVLELWQVFQDNPPTSMRQFYSYASTRIRWCLLNLVRKYNGSNGIGANHESWDEMRRGRSLESSVQAPFTTHDEPVSLAEWTEFHRHAEQLPDLTGEVFNMIWYLGIPQADVARTLNISEAAVRRHWRNARTELVRHFQNSPEW
ncbi:MAG: sigma-70 family RNA polymerase sigma factor [Pirellulaceae bacterium]